jgi:aspartyl-tRNA(Asn)/glutamyl-tRNA(Gln) amidotransferase subunit A
MSDPTRRSFITHSLATGAALAVPARDLAGWTLAEASEAVRRKRVSPVELTEACLARIAEANPKLNAFITLSPDLALERARALAAERWRGPLHGIPVAVKDLFDTAGMRTTGGSAVFANRTPERDAEVVRRLRAAGAVLLGKLNMDEFAYHFTSETSHFGPCRNPWNPALTPGGSSGGSAVAVAAGMCFAALGSDTGGSIRLPASFCGVVGLKPSYGRVSLRGVLPLAWSMDHAGPLTRTVRDAALVMDAIAGPDPDDPDSLPAPAGRFAAALAGRPGSLQIGVPRRLFFDRLDREVEAAFARAVEIFQRLGANVRDVELPEIPPLPVLRAEAFAWHEPLLPQHAGQYHPHTLGEVREGSGISMGDYARSLRELKRLRLAVRNVFEGVDVLATPVAPGPAFPLGLPKPDLVYLRNTLPFNVFGIPAVSVPCGFTRAGLPMGLQLAGAPLADARLLAVAHAFEKAAGIAPAAPPR